MAKFNRLGLRIAGAAAVLVTALAASSLPIKPAAAGNDYWHQHRSWNGDWDNYHRSHDWDHSSGSFYFGTGPGYYYAPPPAYYAPAPGYYYAPAPQPVYPAPSFGFSVHVR